MLLLDESICVTVAAIVSSAAPNTTAKSAVLPLPNISLLGLVFERNMLAAMLCMLSRPVEDIQDKRRAGLKLACFLLSARLAGGRMFGWLVA